MTVEVIDHLVHFFEVLCNAENDFLSFFRRAVDQCCDCVPVKSRPLIWICKVQMILTTPYLELCLVMGPLLA